MASKMSPAEMREQGERLRLAAGGYYEREMLAGADALDRLADVIEYAERERARIHRAPAASMYAQGEYDALTEIARIARGETNEREKR